MAYTKTNWVNGQAPYMNADNMNNIEQGIYDNDDNISKLKNGTTNIDYDNTTSGLTATNVKAAIDEVAGLLDGVETLLAAI